MTYFKYPQLYLEIKSMNSGLRVPRDENQLNCLLTGLPLTNHSSFVFPCSYNKDSDTSHRVVISVE